jgi:hypothetical protein
MKMRILKKEGEENKKRLMELMKLSATKAVTQAT